MVISKKDAYVSGTEICDELEISSSRLSHWKKVLDIPEKPAGKDTSECYYSKESFDKIYGYFLQRQKARRIAQERKKGIQLPENIEELKKQHPLVSNPYCFIESWFPEV